MRSLVTGLPPTSYYLPLKVESTAGITDEHILLLLNAIQTPIMFFFACSGRRVLKKFGRRKTFISGSIGMTISSAIITAASATQEGHAAIRIAGISFLYIFLASFRMSWAPLWSLYPSEALPFTARANGMAAFNLMVNSANFLNAYLLSVAIAKVGYRIYFFYLMWDVVSICVIYLTFVGTKNRNLEQLDDIFSDRHPVRASLTKQKVVLRNGILYEKGEE